MSQPGSVDAATIEKTKQQIRGLVQQIAQLSRSELEPEEYYAEVLQRIVTALAAVGGAVWTITSDRKLRLDYQINIGRQLLEVETDDAQRHLRLLNQVMAGSEAKLVPPQSGAADPSAAGNPTNYLLVLAPMKTDSSVEGILEIFQRPDSQPASQQGYLRFLVQMSQLVGDWLKSRKLRHFSDRQSLWAQIDRFAKEAHNSLDLRETAYTIANEGRRLIGCDRLSVAIRKGIKNQVEAISGQDTLDSRSNIVTLLRKLADRVCATGEPLWYNGTTEDLPPQIEKVLHDYIDESHTKALAVVPIRRHKKDLGDDELGTDESVLDEPTGDVIGAIIVEQIDAGQSRDLLAPRVDLVCQHSARALSNSLEHNNLFLMPLWRTLGKAHWLVRAKTLPKTLFFSALALVVILGLVFWKIEFKPKAKGSIEPIKRANVYFGASGVVQDLEVKHGQKVKKDDLLVRLLNEQLSQQYIEINGKLQAAIARSTELNNLLQHTTTSSEDRVQLFGQMKQNDEDLKSYQLELQTLGDQLKRLETHSPIAGEVITWDIERLLPRGRPVMEGQRALQIADTTGEWEVIAYLPEKDMGHFLRAHFPDNPEVDVSDLSGKGIEVSFVLLSDPQHKFKGELLEVQSAAELHGQEGVSYRLRIGVEEAELNKPMPGAEVLARVHCGRRAAGFVWLHDAFEWIQIHLLF
jgi:multidrug efflux pump subunit AcrA (membrane-fusion protein)